MATLLLHEIVWKRETAINQLLQGLKLQNVLDMVQKFPKQFEMFFVFNNVELTPSTLTESMQFCKASNTSEERAKEFFCTYINDNVLILVGEGTVL